MVKCNFDDLGVIGLLVMRATVFILGVWGHLVEKVVKKLGFFQQCKNPVPHRGQKFKEMSLEKNFVPTHFSGWP